MTNKVIIDKDTGIIFFLSKSGTTEEMIKLVNIINVLKEKNIFFVFTIY
jgi:fructoselysine-6-P-deglycase FrlB-like protein